MSLPACNRNDRAFPIVGQADPRDEIRPLVHLWMSKVGMPIRMPQLAFADRHGDNEVAGMKIGHRKHPTQSSDAMKRAIGKSLPPLRITFGQALGAVCERALRLLT